MPFDRLIPNYQTTHEQQLQNEVINAHSDTLDAIDAGALDAIPALTEAAGYQPATRTTAGVQEAADNAEADDATVTLRGSYDIGGTVQFRCHVDGVGAEFGTSSTSLAPVIACGGWRDDGGSYTGWVYTRTMHLPHVVQDGRAKGSGVWPGTDVGVAIVKLMDSWVHVPYVDNFTYGLVVAGYGTASSLHWGGTGYNTIALGRIYDAKIAIDVNAGHPIVGNAYGWANHNTFLNAHPRTEDSAEGVAVSGSRYLRLTRGSSPYPVTGNHFVTPAFENDFAQYHIELEHADNNTFTAGRYEPSNPGVTTIKAYFSNATDNLFVGGYGADDIEDIAAGGTTNTGNLLITPRKTRPLAVTEPVSIDYVSGVISFDESVSLYASDPDVLRSDDSFRIPAYPRYTRIGSGYLWDSGTELRKKYGSAPTSATDGTAL